MFSSQVIFLVVELCPFGDQPGALSSSEAGCSETVSAQPYVCYQEYYSTRCCQSCQSVHTGIAGQYINGGSECFQLNKGCLAQHFTIYICFGFRTLRSFSIISFTQRSAVSRLVTSKHNIILSCIPFGFEYAAVRDLLTENLRSVLFNF